MRALSLFLLSVTSLIAAGKGTAAVTPPEQLKVPAGFKVDILREAGPGEGSWICMTQDDAGRLYIASQNGSFAKDGAWGGIWRVTLADETTKDTKDTKIADGAQPGEIRNFEKVNVPVGDAMGMLWAFDSLYVSGMGPQGRGIYRCKSSKGDGNLDTATLFKAIPGGAGEHGAHAIILGPDRKLYIVNGNSTGILDGLSPDSPYRHWGEDDLLPRLKDPVATFFDKIKAPYGCVYRTDADGTKWELFAGGFRNPYDIAFNPDGELFTYDADMEWDRGLPWYRPTRILHVVPGGEYGFREGSAKWPAYFPDSLPAVADIGVGCPTGMKFGTDAKGWPEKYRRALFLHDWTYGRILAVTLHEKGASYAARNDLASYTYPRDAEANHDVEVFLSGKGMPVTDLEFLRDGSMVFTVGGRGTAAALYRVSWIGKMEADMDIEKELSRLKAALADAANKYNDAHRRLEKLLRTPGTDREVISDAISQLRELHVLPRNASEPSLPPAELAAKIEHELARLRNVNAQSDELIRRAMEGGKAAANNAPEAQRKLAGGAASEASATTGSPSAKASAPDGAQDQNTSPLSLAEVEAAISHAQESLDPHHLDNRAIINELVKVGVDSETIAAAATKIRRTRRSQNDDDSPRTDDRKGTQRLWNIAMISNAILQLNEQFRRFQEHVILSRQTTGEGDISDMEHAVELTKSLQPAEALVVHLGLHIAKRGGAQNQDALLRGLQHAPWTKLDDFDKIWKLRVLELSFARQGRPSEERVKALMEELLAHYPVPPNHQARQGDGGRVDPGSARAPRAVSGATPETPGVAKAPQSSTPPANGRKQTPDASGGAPETAREARALPPGAPVDDPAWRLNRELCALLVWLSNPELGELNADLAAKPGEPARGKTGDFRREDGFHATETARMTTGTVPQTTAAVLPTTSAVPSTTGKVRFASESLRRTTEAVPSTSETVRFATESLPPTTESVASTTQTVVPRTDTVLIGTDSVVAATEGVSPAGNGKPSPRACTALWIEADKGGCICPGGTIETSRWSSDEGANTTGSHRQNERSPEGLPEAPAQFLAPPPGCMAVVPGIRWCPLARLARPPASSDDASGVPKCMTRSTDDGSSHTPLAPLLAQAAPAPWQPVTFPSGARIGGVISLDGGTAWVEWETETGFGKTIPMGKEIAPSLPTPLLAQAAPTAGKADTLPTEAPPVVAKTPNSGLGPVPNPGADIFPGRKGAAFHAELGRQVIEKTLALMEGAGAQESGVRGQEPGKTPASGLTPDTRLLTPSQEEQIWYALCLRWAHGWTPEQRVRYFRWFHEKAARYTGGNSFAKFVEAIRADAASRVPEAERQPGSPLAEWMHPVATPRPAVLKPRDFVKAWTLPELEAALDKLKDRKPDLARGKDLYTQAQCAQCHLFRDAGGNVGPDLTAVAQRFGRHDILESITDPSKVIGDQYAMITLTILDGKGGTSELSGLVKEESSATITLLTDPLAGKTANLYKNVIVKREKSPVSIMPPALLYTLSAEEVADLIGFLGAK